MTARGRILISLNLAASPASLEQALAGLWPGDAEEIVGLFIEDADVLSLGNLSVAREIRYDDAQPKPPNAATLKRQLRAQASRIRTAFEERARTLTTNYSFQVMRGPIAPALCAACADFDVLMVATSRERIEQRRSLRAQVLGLLSGGPRTLIVVQEAPRREPRIAVLFEDHPGGVAALKIAATIAREQSLGLTVLIPRSRPRDEATLRNQVQKITGKHPDIRYRFMREADVREIARASAAESVRALVLPRDGREHAERLIIELLDLVDCSLIVTG